MIQESVMMELDRMQRQYGLSCGQLARWIEKVYKIKVSRQAIWKRLDKIEKERVAVVNL